MADNSLISQAIEEVGADTANTRIAQAIEEAAADDANARLAQEVVEAGSGDSNTSIAQEVIESAAADSNTRIAQLTIELGRGPIVTPPADSPVGTFVFDLGLGCDYYIVPQLSDSGQELRDKVVKAMYLTGKVTNASLGLFGYGATNPIDVELIEAGNINSLTGVVTIPDVSLVTETKRYPINCRNVRIHTIRVQGRWDGTGIRDRIDEMVYEVAEQGARR